MAVLREPRGLPLWSEYTHFLRRHRAVVGALTVVGILIGLAGAMLQPAQYSATASVALTPVPVYVKTVADEVVPPEVSIDTDAQLLGSPQVLGAIGHALDVDAEAASEHLSVSASPNSHVLHVTVTAESPEQAAEAANGAVDAFIDRRREALGAIQVDQLRELRFLVSQQERALAKEQARRVLVTETDDLFAQILELRASLDELEQAYSVPAEVVSAAAPPQQRDYPNTEVPVVSGALLGLLVGLLVGMVRDRRRRAPAAHSITTDPNDASSSANHYEDYHHV
jgi:uncharacterized protein involved in exopolysaccharide biosynthesis